jgi:lysophospholipase L1-like esterase
MKRILHPLLAISIFVTAGSTSIRAQTPHDFGKWERAISTFEQMDRTNPPPKGCLVFIGSSTIGRWTTLARDFPGQRVVNRGFGGSEIVDSTHFAERVILPYQPRMIFLRAGGNDIHAGKSAEEVFADFKDFVAKIQAKLPEAAIVFISLSPSIARWTQADKEKALNEMVRQYAEKTPRLKYCDVWTVPLGADGRPRPEVFVEDKLHFNAEGYKLLIERVRPFVEKKNGV